MSHRRAWLALAFAGALGTCVTGQSAAQDRGILSWEGATGEDLVAGLGAPESRTALANGEILLQYRWTQMVTEGGYTVSMDQQSYRDGLEGPSAFTGADASLARRYLPSQTVQQVCIARFTLGADDRVRKIGWEGDGCNLAGQ